MMKTKFCSKKGHTHHTFSGVGTLRGLGLVRLNGLVSATQYHRHGDTNVLECSRDEYRANVHGTVTCMNAARGEEERERERDETPVTGLIFLIEQSFPDNLSDSS